MRIGTFAELIEEARRIGPARVAVIEAHDPDALQGLAEAVKLGLVSAILIGKSDKVTEATGQVGFPLAAAKVLPTANERESIRAAIDLARGREVEMLMKGKVTTANLIRAVLDRDVGLRITRRLSQVIVFRIPQIPRLMIMTDGAVNIAPGVEEKADICRNAIDVAHAIGIFEPKVALLAALEFVNPAMPATVDAAALTLMNRRGQITDAYLEGPIALDVPLSRFAAERKRIESPLVEGTDVFVCPNIEAANILYRAITYMAHGESGGLILGASVPLLVLSRAEPPETKLHSIALGLLLRNHLGQTAN